MFICDVPVDEASENDETLDTDGPLDEASKDEDVFKVCVPLDDDDSAKAHEVLEEDRVMVGTTAVAGHETAEGS